MKKFMAVLICMTLAIAGVALAGNVHKDGNGNILSDIFTPIKNTTTTQTKADKTYTPTAGTKKLRFQPSAAITYKLNGTGTGYPVAANATETIGLATRSGVGTAVTSIAFAGASSATKTIYIQEQ
jgi:hypothetical protein